jgi:pilus assembly protein FimV
MADNRNSQDLDMDLDDINEVDEELSSYGVFVKAGPEDIQEEQGEDQLTDLHEESIDGMDLETVEEVDSVEFDLNDEEEELLADLEEADMSIDGESPKEEITLEDEDDLGDLGDLADLEAEIAMSLDEEDEDETIYLEEDGPKLELDSHEDDLVLEEDEIEEEEIIIPEMDSEFDDITIPELDDELSVLDEDSAPDDESVDIELDIEDLDDSMISVDDGELSALDSDDSDLGVKVEPEDEDDLLEDIDLDDFMDKTAPEPVEENTDAEVIGEDFPDLDEDDDLLSTELAGDELELDIDLDDEIVDLDADELTVEEQTLPGAEEEVISLEDMPDTDYSEELDELDITEDESFDDVAAFSDSLAEESQPSEPSLVEQALRADDRDSENTLTNIESELNLIKSELTSLREELSRLRSGGAVQAGAAAVAGGAIGAAAVQAVSASESDGELSGDYAFDDGTSDVGGGFFSSDDEDDTIALTGDELDNILNTAEFTEETGESSFDPEVDDVADSAFEDQDGDGNLVTEISVEEDDPFKGSEDEIQAMAELDIEEELAGIEDLSDDDSDIQLYTGDELEEMELELPELSDSAEVIDGEAEPEAPAAIEIEDEFSIEEETASEEALLSTIGADETMFDEIPLDDIDEDIHMTEDLSPEEEALLSSGTDGPGDSLDLSSEDDISEVDLDESMVEPLPASDETGYEAERDDLTEIKHELKAVLTYMDSLLENLPDEKIAEFAQSEHFATYNTLFEKLGL